MEQKVKPRRFEMGASANGTDDFLKERGYIVKPHAGTFKVNKAGKKGPPQRLSRLGLVNLLDEERIKAGLQPIMRRP